MNDFLSTFEQKLKDLFASKKGYYPEKILNAMMYATGSGGKRIRPSLVYLSAKFCQIDIEKIYPLAIAIELIHSYSLIHDDLPCMDNDLTRRGKPSTFVAFGEATALLCGDGLLNLAYEVLFQALTIQEDLLPACTYLASCAGCEGMVGGQAMEFDGTMIDENTLPILDDKKTGALLKASILAPALIGFDNEKKKALYAFSQKCGLAFQLADDLLDKDKQEKTSYVTVFGEKETVEKLYSLQKSVQTILAKWGQESEELLQFFDFLAFRTK